MVLTTCQVTVRSELPDDSPDLALPWILLVLTTDLSVSPASTGASRSAVVGSRCYHPAMPVEKLSIALEEPVLRAARQAAVRRGMSLSAWLNQASVNALALEDGLAGVAEWEAEHGRPSEDALAAADAVLDAASIGRREPDAA